MARSAKLPPSRVLTVYDLSWLAALAVDSEVVRVAIRVAQAQELEADNAQAGEDVGLTAPGHRGTEGLQPGKMTSSIARQQALRCLTHPGASERAAC